MDDWIRRRPHIAPRSQSHARLARARDGTVRVGSRRAWAPGAALVGDAADFFDPFTGEGIYAALRGAELLAPHVAWRSRRVDATDADAALKAYDRERVHEFSGKWAVERLIGAAVSFPRLMNIAAHSLALRPAMAHTMVGVTGDFVPAREVLRPGYLLRLVAPWLLARPPATPALTNTD